VIGILAFIFAYKFTSNTEIENQIKNSEQFFVRTVNAEERKIDSILSENSSKLLVLQFYETKIGDVVKFTDFKSSTDVDFISARKSQAYDSIATLIANYTKSAQGIRTSFEHQNIEYSEQNRKRHLDSLANSYFMNVKSGIIESLKASNYELYNLINTIATRFGSIVILLFLVQILIRVFRYNSRLASFYRGRSYALEIYLKDPTNLKIETLVSALSPDVLDMGISKSPTEQVLELVKLYNINNK
jgi:hypothetical protein